jgi:hypothetical protein
MEVNKNKKEKEPNPSFDDVVSSVLDSIQDGETDHEARRAIQAPGAPVISSPEVMETESVVDRDVTIVSGAPGSSAQADGTKFKRLSGAARKRLHRLVDSGLEKNMALTMCNLPWSKMPVEKPAPVNAPFKRGRSEDESPQGHVKKTAKLTTGDEGERRPLSFKEAAGSTRVGIRNSEPMSEEQMKMVRLQLGTVLIEEWKDARGDGPKFLGFLHKTGWILVTCADQASLDWLVGAVPKLKPWPEATLSVIPEGELPKPATAITFISDADVSSIEDALALFRIQNSGLNTELWRVLGEKAEQGGKVVTFALDEPSAEALRACGCEVTIGFRKVVFRLRGGPNAPPPATLLQPPAVAGPSTRAPDSRDSKPHGTRGRGGRTRPVRTHRGAARGAMNSRAEHSTPAAGTSRGRGQPAARSRGSARQFTKRAK